MQSLVIRILSVQFFFFLFANLIRGQSPSSSNAVIYVNASVGHSHGNGQSWSMAYDSLHKALQLQQNQASYTQIWVAKGIYHPHAGDLADVRQASFVLKNGLHVYGGFSGHEQRLEERSPNAKSTLSGLLPTGEKVYHVVRIPKQVKGAHLSDFLIENGHANGTGMHIAGGGLYMRGQARIERIHVRHNNGGMGGGAYMENGLLIHSRIEQNEATHYGGGLMLVGGTTSHCKIVGNHVSSFGGGVYIQKNGQLFNSLIYQNTANSYGAGINFVGGKVINNTLHDNHSGYAGGGIYIPMIADETGLIANTIFYNNRANSVARGYELYNDVHTGRGVTLAHNLFKGASEWGVIRGQNQRIRLIKCIYTEESPFVSELFNTNAYLYPSAKGLSKDAGDDAYQTAYLSKVSDTDIQGHRRHTGKHIDIGAYEHVSFSLDSVWLSRAYVLEGEPTGTLVGLLASAGLPAGASPTYQLIDAPSRDSFVIIGNELRINHQIPHYQRRSHHTLGIKATYLGAHKKQRLSIQIRQRPTDFTLSHTQIASGAETNTVIGAFHLPHLDSSIKPRFELLSGRDSFQISNNLLKVGSKRPLHHVLPHQPIRVRAHYLGHTWDKTFVLAIRPRGLRIRLSANKMLQTSPPGTPIGQCSLMGAHAAIPKHYTLLSPVDSFELEADELRVGALPYGSQSRYRIQVKAHYLDTFIVATIPIKVLSGDIKLTLSNHQVANGAEENTLVGQLKLETPKGMDGTPHYTLLNGHDTFKIQNKHLYISQKSPKHLLRPKHQLKVRVYQAGLDHTAELIIEVMPSLTNITLSHQRIEHKASSGTLIGHIKVAGIHPSITPRFELVNETPFFELKNNDALHIGRQSPDHYRQNVHNLIIRARYKDLVHQKMFAIRVLSPSAVPDDAAILAIYPDPTPGPITIKGAAEESIVRIYDTEGHLVASMNLDKEGRLNIAHLPDRAYVLEVFDAQGTLVRRTIIKGK